MRFRLAGYLGWSEADVAERISARELKEWELLERIEPWGEKRADYRAARIIEAVYIAAGCKPDFTKICEMLDRDPKEPHGEQQDDEVLENIAAANRQSAPADKSKIINRKS